MYLHLGQEIVVRMSDIVGIFDLDTTTISKHTKNYLAQAEKKGVVINVSEELPKSFIVCKNGDETKLYISQISCATLLKRTSYVQDLSKGGLFGE